MYLKDSYFASEGPHPADDIGQGYLTFTVPAEELGQLTPEILEAVGHDPEIIEQLKFTPDPALIVAVKAEPHPDTFSLFRNDEVAFDGLSDCGYVGYGLDIAFSDQTGIALLAYNGPALPTIVHRYGCRSAEEAVGLWVDDWAEPLIFTSDMDDQDGDESSQSIH